MPVDKTRFRLSGWMLATLGTLADHVTTVYALTMPHFWERNPLVRALIALGLWWPFDLAVLILATVAPFALAEEWEHGWATYVYPIVYGTMRLIAGLCNLALLLR